MEAEDTAGGQEERGGVAHMDSLLWDPDFDNMVNLSDILDIIPGSPDAAPGDWLSENGL